MALHPYSFAMLKKACEHVVKDTLNNQYTDNGEVVNDALQRFVSLHEWQWRYKTVTLDSVASQEYIALPEDFIGIKDIQATGLNNWMRAVPSQTITNYRAYPTGSFSGIGYDYAVATIPQTTDATVPLYKLDLWPTPSTTTAGVITITYQRIIRALAADTDVPDMPSPFHQGLKDFVRIHAMEIQGERPNVSQQMREEFFGRTFSYLKDLDGGIQTQLGPMRGGVNDACEETRWFYPTFGPIT